MELSHKTTILFSEEQFNSLKTIAKTKGESVGELIRKACEQVYASDTGRSAVNAVRELENLSLPVSEVSDMKKEYIPYKDFA